ncbi:MAG: CYTH domain-containing protein [Aquabacterium sp.]
MQEIELKFQIPARSLAAVQTELAGLPGGKAPAQTLQAAYFDTADRKLAQAHAALRVRQEDADWVQTLKAAGPNAMTRLEDNRASPAFGPGTVIAPDLSLHQSPEVRQALVRDLGWQPDQDPPGRQLGLVQLYGTDMRRTRAQVTVGQGTAFEGVLELALDLGQIKAGSLSEAVRELEIELVSGHPMAVIDAGRDWVRRHGLWLDTQTKAHRGDRLAWQAALAGTADAAGAQGGHVTPAKPPKVAADATPRQIWQARLESCLAHITGNLSELGTAPADVAPVALEWRAALQGLMAFASAWAGTPHALPAEILALAKSLDQQLGQVSPTSTVALARSGAASELCLDLLACLMAD